MKLLTYLLAFLLTIQPSFCVPLKGRIETHIGKPVYKLRIHHRRHKHKPILLKMQYAKIETRTAYELQAQEEHWKGWIGINYEYGTGEIRYIFPCSNLNRVKVQAGDTILFEDGHDFKHFYGPNPDWIAGQKVKLTIRKANGRIITLIVTLVRY